MTDPRHMSAHGAIHKAISKQAAERSKTSVPGEPQPAGAEAAPNPAGKAGEQPREVGGPAGPEPTRFGDWERKGRCIDF